MSTIPAILGGPPLRTKPFPKRRTMGEAEKKAVLEVMDADVLSAFIGGAGKFFMGGEKVRAFEQAWAEKYGFKHAVSVNSWTSGLVTAIGAIGIEPGDEVICPPYTMSASATCALFYGGIPVFADIDPDTFCIDPRSVLERVTARTKAIVVVHLFGGPAAMDEILAIARPRGIKVIEDAAQSPGVLYKGRPVGAIGDLGGFSLNFHKHIHTGEGGMIVTNDDKLAHRCQLIRNHGENATAGMDDAELVNVIGGNYRLTEIQAAIGVEQLKRLDGYLNTRAELAAHLAGRLGSLPGFAVQPPLPEGSTHAHYLFPIKYDATVTGLSRHRFVQAVLAEMPAPDGFEGTPLTEGYVKPLYLSPIYQRRIALGSRGFPFRCNEGASYDYSPGLCPVAERMYERELLLTPLVREPLTTGDMDDLADAFEKVLAHAGEISAASRDETPGAIFTPVSAANETTVR
ncbi:MAG: DegT/DnrJ/EryC1/StrS family aminotransferase [Chthoniobacter sp.]|nr:DegT/DnrJ/EryC1/StrS family aminotransferase [Chthoniobacter sp.]